MAAKKPDNIMNVGFVGSNLTAEIQGVKISSNSYQVGAVAKINTGGVVDFFVNYDLEAGSGYHSHKEVLINLN